VSQTLITTLAKKAFDIYTAPARFALRQGRKGVSKVQELSTGIRQYQLEIDLMADELARQAARSLGIQPEEMTQEQREVATRMALANAEQSLSFAVQELLKALALSASAASKVSRKSPSDTIEGQYERLP
jgi:hypothetical protein